MISEIHCFFPDIKSEKTKSFTVSIGSTKKIKFESFLSYQKKLKDEIPVFNYKEMNDESEKKLLKEQKDFNVSTNNVFEIYIYHSKEYDKFEIKDLFENFEENNNKMRILKSNVLFYKCIPFLFFEKESYYMEEEII